MTHTHSWVYNRDRRPPPCKEEGLIAPLREILGAPPRKIVKTAGLLDTVQIKVSSADRDRYMNLNLLSFFSPILIKNKGVSPSKYGGGD